MAKKTYWEKLKDPRWQRKRLEAMEAANFTCEVCFDHEATLHVHHKAYFKGREPWEYDIAQLAVLCESCHTDEGENDPYAMVGSYLPLGGPQGRRDAAVLICGAMLDADESHPMVTRLFPDKWPFLPAQLAIGRMVESILRAISWRTDLPEVLDLPAAIDSDPEGFKELIKAFVAARNGPQASA